MTAFTTHYDNLQVTRRSNDAVIRAAYKVLCQKYHPDKFDGDPAEAERIMKVINDAHSVLSDPAKKALHDAWIFEQEDSAQNEKLRTQREASETTRRENAESCNPRMRAEEAGRSARKTKEQKKQGNTTSTRPTADAIAPSVRVSSPPTNGGTYLIKLGGALRNLFRICILALIVGLVAYIAVLISAEIFLSIKNSRVSTQPVSGVPKDGSSSSKGFISTPGWNLSTLPREIDGRWTRISTSPSPHESLSYIDSKSISGDTYVTGVWIRQYLSITSPVDLLDEDSIRYSTLQFHLFVNCSDRTAAVEEFSYFNTNGKQLYDKNSWRTQGTKTYHAIKPGDAVEEAAFDAVCS